jgi:hypothetical protein
MEFADEAAVRAAFASPEFQAVVSDRDKAVERLNSSAHREIAHRTGTIFAGPNTGDRAMDRRSRAI